MRMASWWLSGFSLFLFPSWMSWKKCRWDSKTCFFLLLIVLFVFLRLCCFLHLFTFSSSYTLSLGWYMNHVLFRAWDIYRFVGHWGLALNLLFQWERSKIGWIVLDNPCFWSMKKHLDSTRPTWKVTNATKRGLFRIVEVLASLGSLVVLIVTAALSISDNISLQQL
jgi:hypothetical protein